MLKWRHWLSLVILPILTAVLVDQWSKYSAMLLPTSITGQYLQLTPFKNYGLMLGAMRSSSQFYTVVMPTTIGAQIVFLFAIAQYFVPIQSALFRVGLSLFLGGILGNLIDRALLGYVRDFIVLSAGQYHTGVFNIADAIQWIGVAMFLGSYFANGHILFPASERRGKKWIDTPFQAKYCAILVAAGLAFSMIAGALSYTFLKVVIAEVKDIPFEAASQFVSLFVICYGGITICYLVTVFLVGVQLSHRIVGPVKGFENFLDDLLRGHSRNLKLRKGDEFRQFETMALRFQEFFHERLGINPQALQKGDTLPAFSGETYTHQSVNMSDFLGKKTLFLFYRYATCPLCALHLEEIKPLLDLAKSLNVNVVAIFETKAEDFSSKQAVGRTENLLKSVDVPLLADPERKIYRAFRSQVNPFSLFHPRILRTLWFALRRGFPQRKILGRFGQLPAYFFVDESGIFIEAHYGEHFADLISIEKMQAILRAQGTTKASPAVVLASS